ncbi:hypothetical protein ACJX0J_029603 [Zea mays]
MDGNIFIGIRSIFVPTRSRLKIQKIDFFKWSPQKIQGTYFWHGNMYQVKMYAHENISMVIWLMYIHGYTSNILHFISIKTLENQMWMLGPSFTEGPQNLVSGLMKKRACT